MDQQKVVLIHRWSLYADSVAWIIYTWGSVKCGLYKQIVFRPGLTVCVDVLTAVTIGKKLFVQEVCVVNQ